MYSPASQPNVSQHPSPARAPRTSANLPFECPLATIGAAPATPSAFSLWLGYLINPGSLIQKQAARAGWLVVFAVPGSAFALFFLQMGLDRLRTGAVGALSVLLLALLGLAYGTFGVTLIALVGWVGLKALGASHSPGAVIRLFALAYSPTLVYVVLGLVANLLLGWPTAVVFGVTGVLWALGPLLATVRQLTGGRLGASIALATLCGLLVLFGWTWLGRLV